MSNIDKQALRDIAADAESTPLWHAVGVFGEVVDPANPEWKPVHDFCKTFTAERVLALLDELEVAEKRIAELEAREVKLPENITSANAPEVFEIAAEAERLGLRGTYASYAVGLNARGMADKEALCAASIRINGEM